MVNDRVRRATQHFLFVLKVSLTGTPKSRCRIEMPARVDKWRLVYPLGRMQLVSFN
jgi:hypothetical protein